MTCFGGLFFFAHLKEPFKLINSHICTINNIIYCIYLFLFARNQDQELLVQMFNNLIKAVRQRVSADKRRFNMGEIDIDLTYITDRIIGKFGSSGTDS